MPRLLRMFATALVVAFVSGHSLANDAPAGVMAAPMGLGSQVLVVAPTIDSISTRDFVYASAPGGAISFMGEPDRYYMSDGTSWAKGSNNVYREPRSVVGVSVSGDTVRYALSPGDNMLSVTEYSNGANSTQFRLIPDGPLVLVAIGQTNVAVADAKALVVSNEFTRPGLPAFKRLSTIAGSVVPIRVTYTNMSGNWSVHSFEGTFYYTLKGYVNFAQPVHVPAMTGLEIRGSRRIPTGASVQYRAIARYANGVERDVTAHSAWSLQPDGSASLQAGQLTLPSISDAIVTVGLRATYSERGVVRTAERTIMGMPAMPLAPAGSWPMFQGNSRHSGYVPIALHPEHFVMRWRRVIDGRFGVRPVSLADGKVFVSLAVRFANAPALFALNAASGQTIWSRNFGAVNSVNPPSYGYGNVYVQTGNHESDSWLRAFDAESGELAFESPHTNQWSRYLAPTIEGRSVLVVGGLYGGMLAFDALNGDQRWCRFDLPFYDEWTPAVSDTLAFAYFGNDLGMPTAGMYAVGTSSGGLQYLMRDFEYLSEISSLNASPVIGGSGEVYAINRGRLMGFDPPTRSLKWQVRRNFVGQPAVAKGVLYLIDSGGLLAMSESTRDILWTWGPPSGTLRGTVIVTDGHAFVASSSKTYAVDLLLRQSTWSYPEGGSLALGDGTLYIAQDNGALTAINVVDAATPAEVSIFEADPVVEGVRLRWKLAEPSLPSHPVVERADHESGPWITLECEQISSDGVTSAIDVTAAPDATYWYRLRVELADGSRRTVGPIRATGGGITQATRLIEVSPSPSDGPIRVEFVVAGAAPVQIRVFDLAGRVVAELENGTVPAGTHVRRWDPGREIAGGLYLMEFVCRSTRTVHKVALVR